MPRHNYTVLLSGLLASIFVGVESRSCNGSLVSTPGQLASIPKWDLQSTSQVTTSPQNLSLPGQTDTSSWHHITVPRCTLVGCLIASGSLSESSLFMSDTLSTIDISQFQVPWLYRDEFVLRPKEGTHYFLETNGITSRADLWMNGGLVADKSVQAGAYGGRRYDVTDKVTKGANALLVKVYPTDYMLDFGVGFVDWNPVPLDNGTGVWREINLRMTGGVVLGPLRVVTDIAGGQRSARVTMKASVENLENKTVTVDADGSFSKTEGHGGPAYKLTESVTLPPLATGQVILETTIDNPDLWWPHQWGSQTLYTAQLSVSVNSTLSDKTQRIFGIRTVTHQINSFNDSLFSINGLPFQVLGGGYAADMFLRWDSKRFETQMRYLLDMGLNTVRLEGKLEHPEFYEIADRLGVMVMAGWECCDKWEAWEYNDNIPPPVPVWSENDYQTANASIHHEISTLQTHPSVLTFLIGSDFWPSDRAAGMYVDAMKGLDWQEPIIPYAAKKDGWPVIVGPPSMKMEGPYDWVPPNYWWDTEPAEESQRFGSAFGFGSEQGPGVGTPELESLRRFQTEADLQALWTKPNVSLLHMTMNASDFSTRTIYNGGLWGRYGAPTSLEDYVLKAQMMDYEATRAEYEGFSAMWNAKRPATGVVYWMLNGAWPNLHWALFDYYLHTAGAYFGTKVGGRLEHVAFDYVGKGLYLINHSKDKSGARTVDWEVIGLDGKSVAKGSVAVKTEANKSKRLDVGGDLSKALGSVKGVVFLKLILSDDKKATLSRNVYWLGSTIDTLDWANSSWFDTPVSKYADLTALDKLQPAIVSTTVSPSDGGLKVVLKNSATVPAFFVRANLVKSGGEDVNPVFWSDNYVTLWPGETLELTVSYGSDKPTAVQISGKNVAKVVVAVP